MNYSVTNQSNEESPDPLAAFELPVRQWFHETFAAPTAAQRASWPVIASGQHVLVTAPTGSGKTLTAFLWSLNAFAAGRWETGATRVLYVSPLKALNNDIQRNLLTPLEALVERGGMPEIRVQTRSGDTPQSDRQRMLRRPPEILITTPESLMLLLTSARGRLALAGVTTVVLDEIHALVDNRRGTLLLTALERLASIAGEFQRIALSATVRPLVEIARYVAGRDATGAPRPMRVIEAAGSKAIDLRVCFPPAAKSAAERGVKIWEPLAERFREHIATNRATLVFANSRRLAEKLTLKINEEQPEPLAYAHHGSLARDIRLAVEQRLKSGELKAIVATSSLEMGIDIGNLDEVVLVQSPPSIAATLQRIGRAGHGVGEVSRGSLFPTHAQDFVSAAALAEAVAERDIEPLTPMRNPLDVLAQILVSMTASEPWHVEDILQLLKQSGPYETLTRDQLELVVEMLAGRYSGSRVRELKPRISYDRINGVIRAQRGAVLAMYNAGGVIPDRGYFQLRHSDTGVVIGELDEEFVWEATLGQVFTLGTQNWQINRITHNDVLVKPSSAAATMPPFWRSESQNRSFHFSERIGRFLERAEEVFASAKPAESSAALSAELAQRGFDPCASAELVEYLQRQRDETRAPLPHRGHLLVEQVRTGPGGYRGPADIQQLVIHSLWGGKVNRPWALALAAALAGSLSETKRSEKSTEPSPGRRNSASDAPPEIHADDNAIVITTRVPLDPDRVLTLVNGANLEPLLRQTLESSGFFGARFRESAGRALLLTRQRFNQRLPLWMSRLQSKKLMSTVKPYTDFPVLLETWRTCLQDEFDLPALRQCLAALEDGETAVSKVSLPRPSPFAANVTFDQITRYMYADDTPERAGESGRSALDDDLIRGALDQPGLRPDIHPDTVAAYLAKRQRTAPGYQPETTEDWLDWIKERVLTPAAEIKPGFEHPHLVKLRLDGRAWYAHRELLFGLTQSGLIADAEISGTVPSVEDPRDAEQLALDVLSYYGPLTEAEMRQILPHLPEDLLNADSLVRGTLMAGEDVIRYCDRGTFESLLRLQRALQRPDFQARPVTDLPGFLACWQNFGTLGGDEALATAVEPLLGYRAPVNVWLQDLPASRVRDFRTDNLETLATRLGIGWQGCGREQIRLGYPEDLALLCSADAESNVANLFADPTARYGFLQLADRQNEGLSRFNEQWWDDVWNGMLSADSLAPLRQGHAGNYRLGGLSRPDLDQGRASPGRASPGRSRRARGGVSSRAPRYPGARASLGWSGNWMLTSAPLREDDPIADLEEAKDKARLLLDRYGFICRELANREGDGFSWRALFRPLRTMELSGEVLAGLFFHGLSGPQFVLPSAMPQLRRIEDAPESFWVNALDPAAPCGLGLSWEELPQRRPGNYLSFHCGRLALVVENQGRRLTFLVEPDHSALPAILAPVSHILKRQRRLTLASINGDPALQSAYLPYLEAIAKIVKDHRHVTLESR